MSFREELQYRFEQNANAEDAKTMKAYLRDQFDMYGIRTPVRKTLYKDLMAQTKTWTYPEVESLMVWCWDQEQRDYQYFGIDLMQRWKNKLPEEALDFVKYLITNRSWWDTVDLLATNPLGSLCRKYPSAWSAMDEWIDHENMWLRRSAIIYQLKSKNELDEERLLHYCQKRMNEEEFFIRKAIGWALRQHTRVNPELVRKFVKDNENELSDLSKREALKNIK